MAKIKEYDNGEVTVVWEADKCIHSARCVDGLPEVFNPNERPWIKVDAAKTTSIVETVKQCPSGALTYYMTNEGAKTSNSTEIKVDVLGNGPLLVHGTLEVTDAHGNKETKTKTTAFCRCGVSNTKPYCDGTHAKVEFKG